MQNYRGRVPIGGGKHAYVQLDELAEAAIPHIERIARVWNSPSYFYHLRKGGHVAAARRHLRKQLRAKIDLSKFFDHVTRQRIVKRLKSVGYTYTEAEDFAVASTVRLLGADNRYVLPFGFAQSPLLASLDLDMSALGSLLRRLSKDGINLSVYVDDIICSSDSGDELKEVMDKLRAASEESGYEINEQKSAGPESTITAFNILITQDSLTITDTRIAEMEAEIQANGSSDVSRGILNYVRSVNTAQADQIVRKFPNVFSGEVVAT